MKQLSTLLCREYVAGLFLTKAMSSSTELAESQIQNSLENPVSFLKENTLCRLPIIKTEKRETIELLPTYPWQKTHKSREK